MGLMYEMNSHGADVLLLEYDSIRSLTVIYIYITRTANICVA